MPSRRLPSKSEGEWRVLRLQKGGLLWGPQKHWVRRSLNRKLESLLLQLSGQPSSGFLNACTVVPHQCGQALKMHGQVMWEHRGNSPGGPVTYPTGALRARANGRTTQGRKGFCSHSSAVLLGCAPPPCSSAVLFCCLFTRLPHHPALSLGPFSHKASPAAG